MTLKYSILCLLNIQDASVELLREILGDAYTSSAIQHEINLLVRQKAIESVGSNLSLNLVGQNILTRHLYFRNSSFRWDGLYRFVTFNIPESERGKRDKLRRMLKADGYCQLMGALWFNFFDTPFTTLLINDPAYSNVEVIKGIRLTKRESDADKLNQILSLDQLRLTYLDLTSHWERVWTSTSHLGHSAKKAVEILQNYLQVVDTDPRVPEEIMPELATARSDLEALLWQMMNLTESSLYRA